ncbi:hypothetical protein UlMin_007755 [Ulmus minor]
MDSIFLSFSIMILLAFCSSKGEVAVNVTSGGLSFELTLQNPAIYEELKIKRSDFPSDFVFGVGTSAVQEDVKHVKNLGVDSYRFSISWSRILPNGSLSGGINQEGVDHYNSLINQLIENGIKPFVSLLHFDLPQALQDKYGGYMSPSLLKDFKDYSEFCFRTFGDRVKHWITINEPLVIAVFGYEIGLAPPGRCSLPNFTCSSGGNSSTEPYIVAHNLILAHAASVRIYKMKFQATQKGEIGISLNTKYFEPFSDSLEDKAAVQRLMDFNLGWFMEPLVFGDYPKSMRDLVKERLPTFSRKQRRMLRGSSDFFGLNYYTSSYARNRLASSTHDMHHAVDSLASENMGIFPEDLQRLLEFMKQKYQNPKIYITENGINEKRDDKRGLDELLNDSHRINYVLRHLHFVHKAIENDVNVKGYFYWAAFDDFEWGLGFEHRFGLYFIDFNDNFKRIPKLSAKWFNSFLKAHNTTS